MQLGEGVGQLVGDVLDKFGVKPGDNEFGLETYICKCLPGFSGNGATCVLSVAVTTKMSLALMTFVMTVAYMAI